MDINQLCRIKIWQKFMAFRHLYYFPIRFNLQTLQTDALFFLIEPQKWYRDKSTFRKFRFHEIDSSKISVDRREPRFSCEKIYTCNLISKWIFEFFHRKFPKTPILLKERKIEDFTSGLKSGVQKNRTIVQKIVRKNCDYEPWTLYLKFIIIMKKGSKI